MAGSGAHITGDGGYFEKALGGDFSTVTAECDWRIPSGLSSSDGVFFSLWNSGTILGFLYYRGYTTAKVDFWRNDWEAMAAQTTTTYSADTTYHVKVEWSPKPTGGTVKVWIDSNLVIDYTGDTTSGTESSFDTIRFGCDSGDGLHCWFDNIELGWA